MYRRDESWHPIAVRLSALVGVLAVVATTGCSAQAYRLPDDTSKVLQSVDVHVGTDGTVNSLTSTLVATSAASAEPVTTTVQHAPTQSSGKLPLRVLTSYRTADGFGTDLADLAGYTGRVQIDLTVQNLTAQSRLVSYQVDGREMSQQALVAVPLTVVGATELPGVEPDQVITASTDSTSAVSNGVLSQTSTGYAVIQWATILAPPRLAPTATLRLVLDTTGFQVPSFSLSVQPGLVSDPSTTAVIGSALGDSAAELDLQTRTVEVVGDVTSVLTQANTVISSVRESFAQTATTPGAKTVDELRSESSALADSIKAVDSNLNALSEDLGTDVAATDTTLTSVLARTVKAMDQLLGDTDAAAAKPKVTGKGCSAKVEPADKATSVHGHLMAVVNQLDGYAAATNSCKREIQQSVLNSIGPTTPNVAACVDSSSATCSLYLAQDAFTQVVSQLVQSGESAISALQPEIMASTTTAFGAVSDQLDEISKLVTTLSEQQTGTPSATEWNELRDRLSRLDTGLDSVTTQLTEMNQTATRSHTELTELHRNLTDLADQFCRRAEADQLSLATANELRAYLTDRSCADSAGKRTSLKPPKGQSSAVLTGITQQLADWKQVAEKTDPDGESDVATALTGLRADLREARSNLNQLTKERTDDTQATGQDFAQLAKLVRRASTKRETLRTQLSALEAQQAALATTVRTAFGEAASQASGEIASRIDPQIRQIGSQGELNSAQIGELLDAASSGLTSSGEQLGTEAKSGVEAQQAQLHEAGAAAETQIGSAIAAQVKVIDSGVSAAAKDLDGASALLGKDLNQVLLDLGDTQLTDSGLQGAVAASVATAGGTGNQVAQATQTATAFGNLRSSDIAGILFSRAQVSASLEAVNDLDAFVVDLPAGAEHRTIYTIRIGERR